MPLVKDIQTPVPLEDIRGFLLEQLAVANFPVEAWQEEGGARCFVEAAAALGAELSKMIAEVGIQTYLEDASSRFLYKKTESEFDEPVFEATRTVMPVSFVNAGAGNPLIAARQLILRASNNEEFTNQVSFTATALSTTVSAVEARNPGSAGNIPTQTLELVTPVAGVTAQFLGTFTSVGADQESDAKLKERARAKWGTLRVTKIRAGVENLVRNAAPAVFSVGIDDQNPRGPGTVDVYLAGENATAGVLDVAAVQDALDDAFFGNGTEDQLIQAFAAPTLATNLAVTVYYSGVDETDLMETLTQTWRDYLASVPIGGFDLSPGPNHVLLQTQVSDALSDVSGVRAMVFTSPVASMSVPVNTKLIEGTIAITLVAIS